VVKEMSYIGFMSTTESLATLALASLNSTQLIEALEDMGYDEVEVLPLDEGYVLTIGGTQIAMGVGEDALDASENLLDRAADLFYHCTPEA